ncbi:MAG TPA: hypothetical protein VF710_02625 [Longimicrobium sp.]|jgi:hypothetical protein
MRHNKVDYAAFNTDLELPYGLDVDAFALAMQSVYDFFYHVNRALVRAGSARLEDHVPKATLSGVISSLLTNSLGQQSTTLTPNRKHNGHPGLVPDGLYPGNSIQSGTDGIHIKSTSGKSAAVDRHNARHETTCVVQYVIDSSDAAPDRREPMTITKVSFNRVRPEDYVFSPRGVKGTDTYRLSEEAAQQLQANWLYRLDSGRGRKAASLGIAPSAKLK